MNCEYIVEMVSVPLVGGITVDEMNPLPFSFTTIAPKKTFQPAKPITLWHRVDSDQINILSF